MTQPTTLEQRALDYHKNDRPGKLEIHSMKRVETQDDLSLAYTPGVAVPCLAISENPDAAYDYTSKGNLVAVISNGTAVLGLGDIGALASKPVMEGKAILFKKFAGVDSFDLEVETKNVEEFVNAVRYLGPTFGGINLEDIKAPECFEIEHRLKELMSIPIFHDDQHGTAICAGAALLNALEITGRSIKDVRLVLNGAGAAALAVVKHFKTLGMSADQITLVDRTGVVYKGRLAGMNPWKSEWALETTHRTLADAVKGADVLIGLSSKGAFTQDMIRSMTHSPIIMAMANPTPEIMPEEVYAVAPDAIVATGRSDFPNQVNNSLCFPYVFRGTLDVRASTINEAMKVAATYALAKLAKEPVPDYLKKLYPRNSFVFGQHYIIPVGFDPRLITSLPPVVAKAAMATEVAQKPIRDMVGYTESLKQYRDDYKFVE